MNGIGIVLLLCSAAFLGFGSRRLALVALMFGVMYIPQTQGVLFLGFSLTGIRIVELVGFFRVITRGELRAFKFNGLDKLLLATYGFMAIIYSLSGRSGGVYVVGVFVDATLAYITARSLIRDTDDIFWFLKALVFLLIPYSLLLGIEQATGRTPFEHLGMEVVGWNRGGRPRCIGSFRNPTLLGTLGASFLPLYAAVLFSRKYLKTALAGVGACLFIVWASNSGGSLSCALVAIMGWCCWALRHRMKEFRRGILFLLFALAIVMKAPIWYLPAKISAFTGGDGYHRSRLLELAYQHLGEWWLSGMPMADTSNWFPYVISSTGAADMTNYFLMFGITSGLIGFALFIGLIVRLYKALGGGLGEARQTPDLARELLLWGLGVMLTAHVSNWFGITYFDQTQIYAYMQLAMIAGATTPVRSAAWVENPERKEQETTVAYGSEPAIA